MQFEGARPAATAHAILASLLTSASSTTFWCNYFNRSQERLSRLVQYSEDFCTSGFGVTNPIEGKADLQMGWASMTSCVSLFKNGAERGVDKLDVMAKFERLRAI
ncbi:MAG: hypothetical protein NVSMB6_11450 [Burkholderiaceae bacterium]